MQTNVIRIGTRGSRLALWQAEAVRAALTEAHDLGPGDVEIVVIRTTGDRITDRALLEAGGKGLFTKEIEEALLDRSIDLAVHSAKDMPTWLPEGLVLAAYLEREDVRDAVIGAGGRRLADLPPGARLGTASLRRQALVKRVRPDLDVGLLRGNVPTRLKRVEEGEFDATLLALAGLKRLELAAHATEILDAEAFPPACGQGAIVIECREADAATRDLLAPLDDAPTAAALACERAFLKSLDGSCRTPIAGLAEVENGILRFSGLLLAPDGSEWVEAAERGAAHDAEAIGLAAGAAIRARAPAGFLERLGIG